LLLPENQFKSVAVTLRVITFNPQKFRDAAPARAALDVNEKVE